MKLFYYKDLSSSSISLSYASAQRFRSELDFMIQCVINAVCNLLWAVKSLFAKELMMVNKCHEALVATYSAGIK